MERIEIAKIMMFFVFIVSHIILMIITSDFEYVIYSLSVLSVGFLIELKHEGIKK